MFCYQCQEAAKNEACLTRGVCGKTDEVAALQDLLVYLLKGIAVRYENTDAKESAREKAVDFTIKALFTTITNANFDHTRFLGLIAEALQVRDALAEGIVMPDMASWSPKNEAEIIAKSLTVGIVDSENNPDIRSLKELLIYGIKGMAAYADHASVLGKRSAEVETFIMKGLAASTRKQTADAMLALVMECGKMSVEVMALLDGANTGAYGNPEPTAVDLDVRKNPGILVSGHDLKDLEILLEQTAGTGVDVYTHGEMLPAHYYPAFKKYPHLAGNYGNAWWKQETEFDSFNGPILMTTNCLVPPRDSYVKRVFTTGNAGFSGIIHIPDGKNGSPKDFSAIIEMAKICQSPVSIESGTLTGGFAHNAVIGLAETVIDAVKSGAVKKFIVMAGCDGKQKGRNYFTEVAERLPADTIILTAGCAKYRYNKLKLGDIGGIPRVLDAGQCNDSYSLALTALALKDAFGLEDINDLPIEYDIAWYEQKAVTVLLALLYLGVKGIRLGPTLPAFLSPGVVTVLVDMFGIKPTGDAETDVREMTGEPAAVGV